MKPSSLFVLASAVAALAASGCGDGKGVSTPAVQVPASLDLAATRKVIEENNRRFTRAHVTGDQATIDAMFTREARVLPPGAGKTAPGRFIPISGTPTRRRRR